VDWISDNEIQVVFYFQISKNISNNNLPISLKTRLKSIVFTQVEFEMVKSDNILPIIYPQLFNNRTIKTNNEKK
jgi:hypothetical protein